MPSSLLAPDAPLSLPAAFLRTAARHPDQLAAVSVDGAVQLTWAQLAMRVRAFAAGLASLGVGRGDTVALMLRNRPEFTIADVSVMSLGAAPFSIYATLPVAQIVPILGNAQARLVICEQAFLPQVLAACAECATPPQVIVLGGGGQGALSWAAVEAAGAGADFDLDASVAGIDRDDLAVLVYTSGTTGPAKGVELTHLCMLACCYTNQLYVHCRPTHRYLSWLPSAGLAERVVSLYLPLVFGGTVHFCLETQAAAQALPKARPHVFFAPPRFWEKLREGVEERWSRLQASEREQVQAALQQQLERVRLQQAAQTVPVWLSALCMQGDGQWFAPLRRELGLDAEGGYYASGGAAATRDLLEFFAGIGLPLCEDYGQTEASGLGTRSPQGRTRMGTVGLVQPGVELRLAEDGELLLRSPAVMRGYRKQPEATAQAKGADGWLRTGDLATVDADGYWRIVGRKKEMIINSFGKNMSPVNIEAALTSAGPWISQAVVVGDGRRYNVALLALSAAHLQAWAAARGLAPDADAAQLIRDAAVQEEVAQEVRRANEQLARVEQIKKFHLVGTEWMPGSPELTPTMKLRRAMVASRFAAEVEAMYQSPGE